MLESIGKGNLSLYYCRSLYGSPKQTTNKATKRLQHQNRKKYETIVEELRLQLTQVM
jgi:pyruvate formate-lyase activating enzyme-like uncharacterized protein